MGCRQAVRHRNLDPTCKGSNPFTPVVLDRLGSSVVEQLAYNEKVSGSSPLELIIDAGVVELVDTPGLGSGGYMVLRVQVLPSVESMIRKNG